ncbi:MAG: homoserine kinase [Chloroflexi bacterium]|nr:homoserine kinase [Chloroflexota bacterium]
MAMITVWAPATSGNLGPGFDALGLALELSNRVQASPAERTEVLVRGEGEGQLASGQDNLIYRAAARVFAARGQEPPRLRLECENRIPLARGLGSSAAATAAGLLVGNELLGRPCRLEELLAFGTEMEGHPDNVAACLFGGLQACVTLDSGAVVRCAVPIPPGLRAVVLVPSFGMDTHAARGLLPAAIPLRVAVHNLGRTALLVAAMAAGRLDLLRVATEDAIHQPPRQALFPALPDLLRAALDAGAVGAFLSGAGSSVLALVDGRGDAVAQALAATARRCGVEASTLDVALSQRGAYVG